MEREERYIKTAKELERLLDQLNLIHRKNTILDYGCAVGFLMQGFIDIGYTNVLGYDISQWATEVAMQSGKTILKDLENVAPNILIALDVFEHMTDEEIHIILKKLKSNVLVARIPCSTDGGHTFHLSVSQNDLTHINCKDKIDWIMFFKQYYTGILRLNLNTIYDSPGVTCLLAFNEKD